MLPIIGNRIIINNKSYLNIISFDKLHQNDLIFIKSEQIGHQTIYYYHLEIKLNNESSDYFKNIKFSMDKPTLTNTSIYYLSCDGQNCKEYGYTGPLKYYNISNDTDMWKKLYEDILKG